MTGAGPGSRVTAAQRAEVLRLLAENVPVRQVAREVFGDERFRGRVERIKAKRVAEPVPPRPADATDLRGLSYVEAIKVLFERRLAVLLADEVPPSMNELHRLLDVQRQLEAIDTVERMNALRQEQRSLTASQLADLLVGSRGTAAEPASDDGG